MHLSVSDVKTTLKAASTDGDINSIYNVMRYVKYGLLTPTQEFFDLASGGMLNDMLTHENGKLMIAELRVIVLAKAGFLEISEYGYEVLKNEN